MKHDPRGDSRKYIAHHRGGRAPSRDGRVPAIHHTIYAYRSAARTGEPGSVPRRKTSASRDAQDHPGAELESDFKSRVRGRPKIAQIDELARLPRQLCRLRDQRVTRFSAEPQPPTMKTLRADSLASAEGRRRQPALLESPQDLLPRLRPVPPLFDLLHRSLQLLKNRRTFSRSSAGWK